MNFKFLLALFVFSSLATAKTLELHTLSVDFKIVNSTNYNTSISNKELNNLVETVMKVYGLNGVGYSVEVVNPSELEINQVLGASAYSNLPVSFHASSKILTVVLVSKISESVGGSAFKRFILFKKGMNGYALAHEVGHYFCLGHSSDKDNVMFHSGGKVLTPYQLRIVRNCGLG